MKRTVEHALLAWKNDPGRKPLVLQGARQVGKTWILKDFGRRFYDRTHVFDFVEQKDLRTLFEDTVEPSVLLDRLALISGRKIRPGSDLVVFDEIQACPRALDSVKYFCEKAPDIHLATAGSLLGTFLADGAAYPVGKAQLLPVEPMTFGEFLLADDPGLHEAWRGIGKCDEIPEAVHRKFLDALDRYFVTGGMPECVAAWTGTRDPARVDAAQSDLLRLYEADIAKHNRRVEVAKVLLVFRSLVPQLAKENGKFVYGAIRGGARARGYEEAVEWLVSARIVRRLRNVSAPESPLAAYERLDAFKLYMLDVGLLRRMAGVSGEDIVLDRPFAFKGPFTENYVLQQLACAPGVEPRYFAERADREIDFVFQADAGVVPVEAKAGTDKRAKSFKEYVKARRPARAVRFSRRNLRDEGTIANVPLYFAERILDFL